MRSKKKNTKMTVKKGKMRARVSPKKKSSPKKLEKKTGNEKKAKNNKTLLIAQEVKFARLLANNNKKVRDKVLKNLKKWLTVRSQSSFAFTEADFTRLWKGLFYCMWMSDKPLVQEELAESLSKIVHCFNSMDTALLYTKCTLKSLATEWFGIDRYRLDKFEMLVRRILRQIFEMCKKQSWNKQWVVGVGKVIEDILLDPKACLGLNLHIAEIYMEELAKVSEGKVPENIVSDLISPFVTYLASTSDERVMKHVVKNIFRYLIFQSNVGMDYIEKFNVWRQAGFPCKSIDEIEKVEISDDEEDPGDEEMKEDVEAKTKPLDPRAGRVDVELPQIPFNPGEIVDLLKENKFHKTSTTKSRKHVTQLIEDFTKLNKGDMPFGIKEIPIPDTSRIDSFEAAENLLDLDAKLYSDSSKNSRKRKKNSQLISEDQITDEVEELMVPQNCNSSRITPNRNKKFKSSENNLSDEIDEQPESTKLHKESTKTKLPVKKKIKKLLNISDALPNKKAKKTPAKLSNTFSECQKELKKVDTQDVVTNKGSTSFNWNVDDTPITPSSATVTETAATPKKVLTNKKVQKENAELSTKETHKNLLNTDIPWLTPVLTRLEEQNKTTTPSKQPLKSGSVKKRVKIMLQRNTAQNTSDYIRQIMQSPNIPYDANKKPKAGVLKPSPIPSPVNPFYKRKIF